MVKVFSDGQMEFYKEGKLTKELQIPKSEEEDWQNLGFTIRVKPESETNPLNVPNGWGRNPFIETEKNAEIERLKAEVKNKIDEAEKK